MFTTAFWKDAAERAIKTAAQSAIGVLTAGPLASINWEASVGIVGVATAVSVLTSLMSTSHGNPDSASAIH